MIRWSIVHPKLCETPEEWLKEHAPHLKNRELVTLWEEQTGEIVTPSLFRKARERFGVRLSEEAWQKHYTSLTSDFRKMDSVTLPDLPDLEPDGEAAFEALCQLQDGEFTRLSARNTIDITIDTNVPIGIPFSADWHIGDEGVDYKRLNSDIDLINSCPWLYAYIGGDGCANYILESLGEPAKKQTANIRQQWAILRYLLDRIMPSTICIGDGNHPSWTKRLAGIDPTWLAVRDLPAVYTNEGGLLNLTVGSITYRIYRKHKPRFYSGFNPGHAVQQMWRTGECDFDVGVAEHHHEPNIGTFNAHNQQKIWVRTGTYHLADHYAREHGFYGQSPETPVVIFWPNDKRYHPILGLQEAVDYLEAMNGGKG